MREYGLKILAFLMIWSISSSVAALALSEIELKSSLNQPLEARINLLAVTSEDLDSLNVTIHGDVVAESIQQTQNLRHEIKQDVDGYYIQISSEGVIREPIVSFNLEVSWSTGHLIRKYSLLIDPYKHKAGD